MGVGAVKQTLRDGAMVWYNSTEQGTARMEGTLQGT